MKTRTKELTKKIHQNKGIAIEQKFDDEHDFQDFLIEWLKGRTLKRRGYRNESEGTREWDKKEEAKITKVDKSPEADSGFGDVAIHHEKLHLSWNHILEDPFIIECKDKTSFRHAAEQAVRYKPDSSKKYQEKGRYKTLNTGIATPRSLSTGEITDRHAAENVHPINFEAKRIYWKLGIGVLQSVKPDQLVVSFNESDVVLIE